MHVEDGGGRPAINPEQIQVDVRGLDDFAELLRSELDANFAPTANRVMSGHSGGVTFGYWHGSLDMNLLRDKYSLALERAGGNLHAYIGASEVLIAATHKIAEAYRDADALSAARSSEIESALYQAMADAEAARQAALEEARRQEWERRIARIDEQDGL